ncbi:UNKNOWN [Stylonychia lemnae]|uniref:Uncharacterized protein n=1 Tax=Stylonychia lemnae TaxID=5949 RepID=A0A078AK61_STYLE|nr:UNKNOWN [Stylonychia lemnae]|eukprot:CDW82569.1 UNKNOWN [Stylonychia lemnae]
MSRVNKRDVMAYVFLDNECLDSLVLGSVATQALKQNKQENQQSHLNPQAQSQIRAKKVRISLFDSRKKLQIILKKIGAEDKNRFGSIRFSLKKLCQGIGNTYMHWVTLFDDLEDDMYDGQLGEDDYEQPRILIEYTIIGGQYTSVMNNMDKIKSDIDHKFKQQQRSKHQEIQQHDEEAGGGAIEDIEDEETAEYQIQGKNKRGKKNQQSQQQLKEDKNSSKTNDFTLTVEYVESRQDKLKGRNLFHGKIVNNIMISNLNQVDSQKLKKLEMEKDEEITKLIQLCEKFDVRRFKSKLTESLTKALEDLEIQFRQCDDKETVLISFVDKLIEDHKRALSTESTDVYLLSLSNYRNHLKELEQRDVGNLKKQLADMKRIMNDLLIDLESENTIEASLLQQKEDLWDQVDPRIVELRRECLLLVQEIEEIKADYTDNDNRAHPITKKHYQEEESIMDDEEQSFNQEQGSTQNQSYDRPQKQFVSYLTKEERKAIAKEMFEGCDDLFQKHMKTINEMFSKSKNIQKQREVLLKELASAQQNLRDQELINMRTMENIDEQIDRIFELKQHIEYIKKDLISTRKRQLGYLAQLFELYKSKDAEIERLQLSLYMTVKEKEILDKRRDDSFNQLLELLVERRRILSQVQDYSGMMGMQYDMKAQANSTRMQAHEMAENSMQIWSSKLSIVKSALDPAQKREQEYKLQQMIRELEIKQKSLLKLIQTRDSKDAKHKINQKKYEVHGKLGESLELLVLLIKEAKEDRDEIKDKLKETRGEMDDIDRQIRHQEQKLDKSRREYQQTEDRLVKVNKDFSKVDPRKNQQHNNPDSLIDKDIIEARRQIREKDERLRQSLRNIISEDENYEQIDILLSREIKKSGIQGNIYEKIQGDVFKFINASDQKRRLVQIQVNSAGSLEVQYLVADSMGRKSMKKFGFSEFLRNMSY